MNLIWQPLSLVALGIAAYIGLILPDIDQRVGFLLHRSIITHGPLFPLAAFILAQADNPLPRRFGMGMGLGYAVHMAFDLFPRSWQGYALISIPAYGWIPAVASWIWIAATILLCMALAIKLARHLGDALILLLALAAVFVLASGNEEAFWLPMLATVASFVVGYWVIKPTKKQTRQALQTE